MKHWLTSILVMVLALPTAAQAFGRWTSSPECAAAAQEPGQISSKSPIFYCFDAATDSGILLVPGGLSLNFEFEPDWDGTDTAASVTIFQCSTGATANQTEANTKTNACAEYAIDKDGDGAADATPWTGAAGNRGFHGPGFQPRALYLQVDTAPGSGATARAVFWASGQ